MTLFFQERILYQKSIPTTQLQLYRTVNDGKECQEILYGHMIKLTLKKNETFL